MEKPSAENGRLRNPVSCPRCQSSNTKFCYYNNHNVNQPRHFCRDCQRYWTAGGSLRNVPIGAGKRKHKGSHVLATKPEDMPSILSFHSDQGVYTPSLESSNVLSFKQPVAHNCDESKMVEAPCVVPKAPLVTESKPQGLAVFASRPHVPAASYGAPSEAPRTSAFVCPLNSEKPGFTDLRKQPSLSLGLNLSKEAQLQKDEAKMVSHINSSPPHLVSPQQNACSKQESRPAQYTTEGDDSTGCSSVTTNLGPSVMEAVEVSTKSTINAPTMPAVEQATSLLNPMVALGASMCPPWVWPFIMGGHNVVPPSSLPQVDPAFVAATIGAMASMPPINPALTAAMGAMASSGRLPQIDPSVMAAITASILQFPHIWSPYTWGLSFSTPWNMTSAVLNAPNGVSKRPASPSPEEDGQLKSAKREHLQETSHSMGSRVAESVNAPNYPYSTGYFDAFRAKPDVSPLKSPVPLRFDQRLNIHQQRASPHLNPAAEARSAAFQEGN